VFESTETFLFNGKNRLALANHHGGCVMPDVAHRKGSLGMKP
jgi:hypothetical protein